MSAYILRRCMDCKRLLGLVETFAGNGGESHGLCDGCDAKRDAAARWEDYQRAWLESAERGEW